MIAATVLAWTVFGACLATAAWLAERCCVRLNLPRRWTWLIAMLGILLMPLAPTATFPDTQALGGGHRVPVSAGAVSAPDAGPAAGTSRPSPQAPAAAAIQHALLEAIRVLAPLDAFLLTLWACASLVLLTLTVSSTRRLAQLQRTWKVRQREGITAPCVLTSDDVGPAAFGVGRGRIVIPIWAMQLPPLDRRLLLLHERFHVQAHDPRLLAVGLAMLIIVPWHVPLRWCFRRLQRAVEHDCDRRVLHRTASAKRYASLLLRVAERGMALPPWHQRALATGGPTASMTSLLSAHRDLECRLRALTPAVVSRRSRCQALLAACAAVVTTMAACAVPLPRPLALGPTQPVSRTFVSLGTVVRDPAWMVNRTSDGSEGPARNDRDSLYFARSDSLVIAAIEQTLPALLQLAATATPYVAIAVTEGNEVVAHSIAAGRPVRDTADAATAAARRERAAGRAGLPSSARNDAEFAGRMGYLVNGSKGSLDNIGVSHLKVGADPLTVLWVRFRAHPSI